MELMGQQLFAPPNVKGWEGGKAWLNTATVLARHNFAHALVNGMGDLNEHAKKFNLQTFFPAVNPLAFVLRAGHHGAGEDRGPATRTCCCPATSGRGADEADRPHRRREPGYGGVRPALPGRAVRVADAAGVSAELKVGRLKDHIGPHRACYRSTIRRADPCSAAATSSSARSLVATAPLVPGFLARTARAAEPGKDTILVVLEMTGGNDGLNTVIPYTDDLYHKAAADPAVPGRPGRQSQRRPRPAPGLAADGPAPAAEQARGRPGRRLPEPGPVALRVDGHLAVRRGHRQGQRDRLAGQERPRPGQGQGRRRAGHAHRQRQAAAGVPRHDAGGVHDQPGTAVRAEARHCPAAKRKTARKKLLDDVAADGADDKSDDLLPFVQRRHLQTYTSVEKLKAILKDMTQRPGPQSGSGRAACTRSWTSSAG